MIISNETTSVREVQRTYLQSASSRRPAHVVVNESARFGAFDIATASDTFWHDTDICMETSGSSVTDVVVGHRITINEKLNRDMDTRQRVNDASAITIGARFGQWRGSRNRPRNSR
ncbi:hypothetical protein EVAR_76245_1 [Eumeta japonica]|uniref:Uncharacterized protein n=1 Tax=Eumeta variegata TaxID=151549 RepID=A0A4C1UPK8_EUMVA|nr:hypothetical protein EVAR_76245_1 [Eumeta japonica]